jgi:hypothetical protein
VYRIFIYFFSLFFSVKKAFQKTKTFCFNWNHSERKVWKRLLAFNRNHSERKDSETNHWERDTQEVVAWTGSSTWRPRREKSTSATWQLACACNLMPTCCRMTPQTYHPCSTVMISLSEKYIPLIIWGNIINFFVHDLFLLLCAQLTFSTMHLAYSSLSKSYFLTANKSRDRFGCFLVWNKLRKAPITQFSHTYLHLKPLY